MFKVVHNRLGDANSGAGYGTTVAKSSGISYPAQSTYPYYEKSEDVDDVEFDYDDMFDDISRKIGLSNIAKGATSGRTDRSSFTKMRLDLMESSEDTHIMQGMVPFPFSQIYGKFTGPAMGGFKTNAAYTTAPGKNLKSTIRGWSQAQNYDPLGDKIEMRHINDLIDPSMRSLAKANLMIKLSSQESD